jgi:rhodanese-related sulfurtransferase
MLVLMLGLTTLATGGCKPAAHPAVKELTVAEAAAAHKTGAVFVDANDADFRKSNGKVPGAVLLDSYRTYDVKALLPEGKDTPLVFYCSNKR